MPSRPFSRYRQNGHTISEQVLALARADYLKLSVQVAQRTVRFWKVRETAEKS